MAATKPLALLAVALLPATAPAAGAYKKRVLDNVELSLLNSFYTQSGDHAAVNGGIGTEALNNVVPAMVVVAIPVKADGVLTINGGVSVYTSASSGNLNPLDGDGPADPGTASSGASDHDKLASGSVAYAHSSNNRRNTFSFNLSFADEYDYQSFGFGGGYTRLLNKKNTSLSVKFKVYLDNWDVIYPYELGGGGENDDDDDDAAQKPNHGHDRDDDRPFDIINYTTTGNPNYAHSFTPYGTTHRNTYNLSLGLTQILSKRIQGALLLDLNHQTGQLANHMQRVYFKDVQGTFIDNYQLADDVERLPETRNKAALGLRLNTYISQMLVLRAFYRLYADSWGVQAHTASLEAPIKVSKLFTLTPTYRFTNQTAAKHFAPYDQHLSTSPFYTSDYDLSAFSAHQAGAGIAYADPLTRIGFGPVVLKSVDLRAQGYQRSDGLTAFIVASGLKLVLD